MFVPEVKEGRKEGTDHAACEWMAFVCLLVLWMGREGGMFLGEEGFFAMMGLVDN